MTLIVMLKNFWNMVSGKSVNDAIAELRSLAYQNGYIQGRMDYAEQLRKIEEEERTGRANQTKGEEVKRGKS